jgi:beta-lactamase class C
VALSLQHSPKQEETTITILSKAYSAFAGILIGFLSCTAGLALDPVLAALPKLEASIIHAMEKKKIPGLAVAVVYKGKIVYIKGFGVRSINTKEPVNQHTVFQLGSVSKAISSTLALVLKREQFLHLDQPIEIIPELQSGTTLRHILNHSTGFPSGGFNRLIENGASPLQVQKKLVGLEPIGAPGEKFAYHNVVYNLVVQIIEHQTGQPFEAILQQKLLRPLGMMSTSSTWDGFVSRPNRAFTHTIVSSSPKEFRKGKGKFKDIKKGRGKKAPQVKKRGITQVKQVPPRREYANFPAAGGFSSSIHDMALFLAAVMGARPDILPAREVMEFITPVIHTPDQWGRTQEHRDRITQTQYGLGWRYLTFADQPLVFHAGWIRGISPLVAFLPNQQVGVVILQNVESGVSFRLTMQFFDWVLGLPDKLWLD